MKRTCRGCKALRWDKFDGVCSLQYKTKLVSFAHRIDGHIMLTDVLAPLEECPKPRTNKRYVELSLERDRHDG